MREAGKKQLIIGLVIAGVGLAISVGSYAAASSNGGGGYFLMFGLVIVGLMRAFRGFSMMKAAGSRAPAAAATAPASMPAMPPQPQADASPSQAVEHATGEPSAAASPPPPPAPTSMWD
jgi:hypothetical protein